MNSSLRSWALLLLFVTAFPWVAWGQEPSFKASVDRNPVGVGEQFTLSLTLSDAGMNGGKNLKLPDLSKFLIMSGPNQSSSMQMINGVTSTAVTYSYVLQPKAVGKATIGAATVEAGGKTLHTAPVTVEVVRGATRPQQQQTAANGNVQLGDNLFLRAVVNRSRVLQGEQINITFKLYTRVSVLNYALDKAPTMTGFWGEDVELPREVALSTETVNGKTYQVGMIKKMALFPTQSGLLEIGPMAVQTTVQVQSPRSNDPFDAFFRDPFGRTVNYPVQSAPVRINVDPLPPGAPAEFKGAVGQFAMTAIADRKTTRTNEPVSLKITISGTGNIKLLESPVVQLPVDFEQYTPKITDNIDRHGDRITGTKTFEYLLIPRYPGLKTIQPVVFAFFDPAKREYVRLRSPQIELNVEQGATQPAPYASGTQENVRLLTQDIRFIKASGGNFIRRGEYPYTSPLFAVLLLLPIAGLAGAFIYARRRQAVASDEAGYRNRRAIKVARKGLKDAAHLLKESSGAGVGPSTKQRVRFYAEVAHALWKYLGDKLGIPQAEFSIEGAMAELARRGVHPELRESLRQLLESCDMARFAPTNLGLAAMQKTYDEASRIIVELERTLR